MSKTEQKFLIWWKHDGVSLCDWLSCDFFNKHAIFSKHIFFVEFRQAGQRLPKGVELLLPELQAREMGEV